MEIPHQRLSPKTLQKIIEEFVLREGTDYGHVDVPLETKTAQIKKQLEKGVAKIIFDPKTESCNIVRA